MTPDTKLKGLLMATFLAILASNSTLASETSSNKNILFIMLDDLDERSFNLLLDDGWLPNIESQIVNKGIRFEQSFVTNSVCCPSRATFLTGQYTKNHGILSVSQGLGHWQEDQTLAGEENTLVTWLHKKGYKVGHVGKYLNGYGYLTEDTYVPPGYDYWAGLVDPDTYRMYNFKININGKVKKHRWGAKNYQTDVLTTYGLSFLEQYAGRDQPFFLIMTPTAPHVEMSTRSALENILIGYRSHYRETIRPPKRYQHLVDGVEDNGEVPRYPESPSFNEQDLSDKPSFLQAQPTLGPHAKRMVQRQFKERLASIIAVDDMIGSLTDTLENMGEMDNTMIIFTSDNGYMFGEHRLNAKLYAFDEAIRVPLIIRPPGGSAKRTSKALIINNDHAPTIAAFTGAAPERIMDGTSYLPLLTNPDTPWARKRFLIEHYEETGAPPKADPLVYLATGILGAWKDLSPPPYQALREISPTANSLLVLWDDQHPLVGEPSTEFYNLSIDPYQMDSQQDVILDGDMLTLEALMACEGPECWQLETH